MDLPSFAVVRLDLDARTTNHVPRAPAIAVASQAQFTSLGASHTRLARPQPSKPDVTRIALLPLCASLPME
jgi:hypothetical protein